MIRNNILKQLRISKILLIIVIISLNILCSCTSEPNNTVNINLDNNEELQKYIEKEINTILSCKIKGNIECSDNSSIDKIIKTSKNTSYIRLYTQEYDDIHKWINTQALIKTKLASLGLKSTIYVYFIEDSQNINSIDINNYADKIVI